MTFLLAVAIAAFAFLCFCVGFYQGAEYGHSVLSEYRAIAEQRYCALRQKVSDLQAELAARPATVTEDKPK